MKYFKLFLLRLLAVELTLFIFFFFFLISVKGIKFSLSFFLGYTVVAIDFVLIALFSRKLPDFVKRGEVPKSGLTFRLMAIVLLLLGFLMFTDVNLFAIILAVTVGQFGLLVTLLLEKRELERWKEQQSK